MTDKIGTGGQAMKLHSDEHQETYYRDLANGIIERAIRFERMGYKLSAAQLRGDANLLLTHAHNIAIRRRWATESREDRP